MIATLDLTCTGCGAILPADTAYPFRCPNADSEDGRDHVLAPAAGFGESLEPWIDSRATQPFVRFRAGLWSHAVACARGLSDADYVEMVETLDTAVAAVDGHGFQVTPFAPENELAARLGMRPDMLWVKDETGNVAGSHKGRHLFGLLLALEVAERTGRASRSETDRRGLAIASCGNAALAAAVLARAARRPLRVFIPTGADSTVVARLRDLSAEVVVCPRAPGVPGDPCLHAFHEVVKKGALPFCCQGSENGLCLEGGMTLAWEMVETLAQRGAKLDRLFVQVGGGALASACLQGLRRAVASGALARMPRLHAVQTESAWPLRRAYERLRARLLPGEGGSDAGAADRMAAPERASARAEALDYASAHRDRFMWAWESAPHSLAHGILDDETYDWLEVTRGLLETGGWPVTVNEERIREAHVLARAATAIPADPTGTAGLAGLMELRARGALGDGERVAVLFSGVQRFGANLGGRAQDC